MTSLLSLHGQSNTKVAGFLGSPCTSQTANQTAVDQSRKRRS